MISYKDNYRYYVSYSKWQFLVLFSSHPFESIGSHNLQTIFEDLIIFPFVLQSVIKRSFLLFYMYNMVFFGTPPSSPSSAMWTVWLYKSPSISLVPWRCCGEWPLCSHYKRACCVSPPKPSHLLPLQLMFTEHSNEASLSSHQEPELEIWKLRDFSFSLLWEECRSGALYKWRDHMRFTDMPSVRQWPIDKGVTESKRDNMRLWITQAALGSTHRETCPEAQAGPTVLPQ